MAKGLMWRVGLPTLAVGVATSGTAIAITYATAWRDNVWAWVAVGMMTLAGAGVSVWTYVRQQDSDMADLPGAATVIISGSGRIKKLRILRGGRKESAGPKVPRVAPSTVSSPGQRLDRDRVDMSDSGGRDVT